MDERFVSAQALGDPVYPETWQGLDMVDPRLGRITVGILHGGVRQLAVLCFVVVWTSRYGFFSASSQRFFLWDLSGLS